MSQVKNKKKNFLDDWKKQKCQKCGKLVDTLYYNRDEKIWECKDCYFKSRAGKKYFNS